MQILKRHFRFIDKGLPKVLCFRAWVFCGAIVMVAPFCCYQFEATAEPMESPSLEEAVGAPCIVRAEFLGYNAGEKISYFHGPIAEYRVKEVLKGEMPEDVVRVRYDFDDGSACIAPQGWEFSEKLLPEKGSSWILFLARNESGIYLTYRGEYGRWQAGIENIDKIKALLKN